MSTAKERFIHLPEGGRSMIDTNNKVEFVRSHSFTCDAEHTRCDLCAGGYEKWTYQYVKVTSGPLEGAVVCPDCLKAAEAGTLSERLKTTAERYAASAQHCQEVAEVLRNTDPADLDLPTFAEWREREEAADAEYVKARGA